MLKLRWWRDRARFIVVSGLAVYALGFFLDWIFDLAASGFVKWLGVGTMCWGSACVLLWYFDAGQGEPNPKTDNADEEY